MHKYCKLYIAMVGLYGSLQEAASDAYGSLAIRELLNASATGVLNRIISFCPWIHSGLLKGSESLLRKIAISQFGRWLPG